MTSRAESAVPTTEKRYRLLQADGATITSATPGLIAGNARLRIYGRLDCRSAIRALPRGYAKRRVFFADEATAIVAGYRPCGACMRTAYATWKATSAAS
ncbi:MAG: Ada metal-binding domain-containing protein [Gemmatimonadaceae bacterium]